MIAGSGSAITDVLFYNSIDMFPDLGDPFFPFDLQDLRDDDCDFIRLIFGH